MEYPIYMIEKIEKKIKDSLFFAWIGYFNCSLFRNPPVFTLYLLFILNLIISLSGKGQ